MTEKKTPRALDIAALTAESTKLQPEEMTSKSLIDLAAIRVEGTFDVLGAGELVLNNILVRKPRKHEWVRTTDIELRTAVIEIKDGELKGFYLVAPYMRGQLGTDCAIYVVRLTITKQGVVFFWPAKEPTGSQGSERWAVSAVQAQRAAEAAWVRVQANMNAGCYQLFRESSPSADPVWPSMSFDDMLQIAFADRYIDSPDHPVVRELGV